MVFSRYLLLAAMLTVMTGGPVRAEGRPNAAHSSVLGANRFYHAADRGYFTVVNRLDEDLYVFAEPAFSSPMVRPIKEGEIVASDGVTQWGGFLSWRRIAFGTSHGWIPERQLIRARPQMLQQTAIPAAGTCQGYAPPWTANWNER